MNIEGITLLNQFIEYSYKPLIITMIIGIAAIIVFIGILILENDNPIGILMIFGSLIIALMFGLVASEQENKTFLNYPAYTHYIIQIDDKAAWTEIAPNYTIVKEVYPNTSIYEIKREYQEGDE